MKLILFLPYFFNTIINYSASNERKTVEHTILVRTFLGQSAKRRAITKSCAAR
nr:MAG TPA: hypothetical protein [Bacteriophage sp.]